MKVSGRIFAALLVATSCHAVAQTTPRLRPVQAERSTGNDNPYLAYAAVVWDIARIDTCANDWAKGGDMAGSHELRQISRQLASEKDVRMVTSGFRRWLLRHYGDHRIMGPGAGSLDTIQRINAAAATEASRIAMQNPDWIERTCERTRSDAVAGRPATTPVRTRFPAGVADIETSATGRTAHPIDVDRMLPDAALDALWRQNRRNELNDVLTNQNSPTARQAAVDWLRTRLQSGGGLMEGLMLAWMLWENGNRMVEHDGLSERVGDAQDRLEAANVLLYTRALAEIDGRRCEDPTAAGKRLAQLSGSTEDTPLQPMWQKVDFPIRYLSNQPAEVREAAVDAVIAMERRTAVSRRNDDLLCGGGKEGLLAARQRNDRLQVPTNYRHYDGTIGLEPPADWEPGFLAPAKYEPLQDQARTGLRDRLLAVVAPSPPSMPSIMHGFAMSYLLFFDEGSDAMTTRGREVTREIADRVLRLALRPTKIRVMGYTDTRLGTDASLELSHRRARNVGRELARDGVDPDSIWIDWFGKAHLLVPTEDGVSDIQNNRVEVTP